LLFIGKPEEKPAMLNLRSKLVFMILVCLCFAGYSYSDVRSHVPVEAPRKPVIALSPSALDERLLSKIHQMNLMQIEMGQLAEQKGTAKAIRAYGDRLERDHRFADQKILMLAQKLHVDVNKPLPFLSEDADRFKNQMNRRERLREAQRINFDEVFLDQIIVGQGDTIEMLTNADQMLDENMEIKHAIEKIIPILRQQETVASHLSMR
jgi:predicted outer membrane protein